MDDRWLSRFLRAGLAILLMVAVPASPARALNSPAPDETATSYIVVLQDGVNARAVALEHAAQHGAQRSHLYSAALNGYAARIPAARLAQIKADRRVKFVSADGPAPLQAQTLPTGVNRIDGETASTSAVNVPVAILDSGIAAHSDLNVAGGTNCSPGAQSTDPYTDGFGHGTHVAGIVGAKNDGTHVVGVAPGAPLYAVKTHDNSGNAQWSNVICGLDWVAANTATLGIKLINMSVAGDGADDQNCGNTNADPLHQAICRLAALRVMIVAAAGNNSKDFATVIPAAYNEVLTATAMSDYNGVPGGGAGQSINCLFSDGGDTDDTGANLGNFATTANPSDIAHTIAAPGACILSTSNTGGTTLKSGTSMAAPHVVGAVARCIASGACADKTPAEIIAKLRSDAQARADATAQSGTYYGFTDDPRSPNGSRYYGYLVYAGGYPVPTGTPTPTNTPTPTDTPLPTSTPTDTPVPTSTPTDTPLPTEIPTSTSTPTTSPVLDAPSDLTATAMSSTSIKLEWTYSSGDLTRFEIERCRGKNCTTVEVNASPYTDTGLSRNTSYIYRIRAINGTNYSAWSDPVTAKTPK